MLPLYGCYVSFVRPMLQMNGIHELYLEVYFFTFFIYFLFVISDLQDLEAKEGKGKENGEDAAMDVEEAKNEGENSEEKGETSETAKHVSRKDDDELDFETKYGMEDYDDKEDEDEGTLFFISIILFC